MWLLAVQIGFVGFVISLFVMIWRGFDRHGLARRSAPLWFLSAVLFFVLMCMALPRVPRPDKAVEAQVAARQTQPGTQRKAQNKEP